MSHLSNQQVQNNIDKFNFVKDRARKLIELDAIGKIDETKRRLKNEGKISASVNNDGSLESVNIKTERKRNQESFPQMIPSNISSKLPKEIMESFKNKQINVNSIGSISTNGSSILDDLNVATNGNIYPKNNEIIEENKIQVQESIQPQILANAQSIDYSLIKMIVEDCIKKYTSSLKKSMLNESKINEQNGELKAMKIGDKFSFITKNGDLYEAKLEFKGNINKKKKAE